MHIIDRYAYTNRIRNVDPVYKAGFALAVLVLCLLLNEPMVGLVAVIGIWALATFVAGLPVVTFGRIVFAESLFLMLITAGVAVSVSIQDPTAINGWAWKLGPLWISSSPESLDLAVRLVTRALGGTAAMNFLAMTTPLVDLVDLFRRLGVPAVLIDVMTVMYRFIFILLDSLDRMYIAQNSRLGYRSWKRAMFSAGQIASRVFIEAYQRSERLQARWIHAPTMGNFACCLPPIKTIWHSCLSGAIVISSLFIVWSAL